MCGMSQQSVTAVRYTKRAWFTVSMSIVRSHEAGGDLEAMKVVASFDDLLEEIGGFGKYQIVATLLLCIPANLVNAWTFFNLVFMLYTPEHHCQRWNVANASSLGERLNGSKEQCDLEGTIVDGQELHCEKWTYDKRYFEQTLATQWDLICDRDSLSKHVMAIFSFAGLIGLAVMSVVQDKIGRKAAFFISLTLTMIGSGFSLLAPTFGAFVAIRTIQQTQVVASYNIPFVWALEFVGPEKRTLVNFFMVLFYAVSTVSVGLVAYACRTWVELGLVTSVPFLLVYAYIFLVDESPRWLLSAGKVEEAAKVLEKMARWNRKEVKREWLRHQLKLLGQSSEEEEEVSCGGMGQLFRPYHLRMKLILLTVAWIANASVYNTVAFNAAKLGNLYVAYIIQAAVEAPACIFNVLLSNRIGRLPLTILAMYFSATFSLMCVPAYVEGWDEWFVAIFAALAKFGICISWNVLYQATGEMYPTAVRATGGAFSNVIGDAFIGVMPYILQSSAAGEWLPMCILGILTFIGACCVCVLPETMDRPMPQTVEEAERISKVELANVKIHMRNLVGPCYKKTDNDNDRL